MTRRWACAVECSLSSASVVVATAVAKPKVTFVPLQIVVDRLRHADDARESAFHQAPGEGHGAVAAERHQRVDAELPEALHHPFRHVGRHPFAVLLDRILEGVAAVGRAEDRAAEVDDAAHRSRLSAITDSGSDSSSPS